MAQATFAGNVRQGALPQPGDLLLQAHGQSAAAEVGDRLGTHIELAVHEALAVSDGDDLCVDDPQVCSLQLSQGPFQWVFAIGLVAGEQEAGVA